MRRRLAVMVGLFTWAAQASSTDCVRDWKEHTLRPVSLRVIDGYGDDVLSAAYVDDQLITALPWQGNAPECLEWVEVRLVESGERLRVRLEREPIVLRVGARRVRASVTAFGEVASVLAPGWGDGVFTSPAGGVRFDVWGRYAHASFALKESTFATNVFRQTPQFVFDVFLGLSHDWVLGDCTIFLSLDGGLWSDIVPSLRVTAGLTVHPGFLPARQGLSFLLWAGPSVFPLAAQAPLDREAKYRDLGFDRFVFVNAGLSLGWSFL